MHPRFIPLAALIVALVASGRAVAQPDIEAKDGKVTYAVTLSPATYPTPASRVYLLPEFNESIPGNRVQMFLRCFMEQDNFFGKAESEKRQKWAEMPIKDLPVNELKDYGGHLIDRDMYDAARMTNADWQLWYFVRRDALTTLLPDVQKMRALADALKTRARGEIAAGDHFAAVHTLKTMFGLARTLESHPTLIGSLVGLAISSIGCNTLEELIQQPGCPNLFWALTDLPAPFISLRSGMEGERSFISHDFESLRESADPVNDAVVMKKIEFYAKLFKNEFNRIGDGKPEAADLKAILQDRAKDENFVKAARGRLIQAGVKAEHVNVWSPLHVVLLDEVLVYEHHRDELGKWFNLPYWKGKPGMDAAEAEMKKHAKQSPFIEAVPAVMKVKQAQARLDQRLAYLQIMEAIRLHAHANAGNLPATLADIKLPLPIDPVSGKSFEYTVAEGVATLHGANPNPAAERTNRYYEIRLRK